MVKALRAGIDAVYGSHNLVQCCRNHKLVNELGRLPKDQHDQTRSAITCNDCCISLNVTS